MCQGAHVDPREQVLILFLDFEAVCCCWPLNDGLVGLGVSQGLICFLFHHGALGLQTVVTP